MQKQSAENVWGSPEIVESFVVSPPNPDLISQAQDLSKIYGPLRILDIGAGAGRNTLPLLRLGHHLSAIDQSPQMLEALIKRIEIENFGAQAIILPGTHDRLDFEDRCFDLVVAHGVWNLAKSDEEFELAVREALRVLKQGGRLFIFTFHKETIPLGAEPILGQEHTFANFAGYPQVFVDENELFEMLGNFAPVKIAFETKIFNRPIGQFRGSALKQVPRNGSPVIVQMVVEKG